MRSQASKFKWSAKKYATLFCRLTYNSPEAVDNNVCGRQAAQAGEAGEQTRRMACGKCVGNSVSHDSAWKFVCTLGHLAATFATTTTTTATRIAAS